MSANPNPNANAAIEAKPTLEADRPEVGGVSPDRIAPIACRIRKTKKPLTRAAVETGESPKALENSEERTDEKSAAESSPAVRAVLAKDDEDNRLYAVAHDAHFVRHDSASALTAWDTYLTLRPDGRFAVEARYNRALCLIRLERFGDAKAALQPFRDGRFASYRKREATRLLDALDHR